MLPRFGHTLLSDRRGQLWLFGGYSLSHGPLNDIRLFDTKTNTWTSVEITIGYNNEATMPKGRYFHAAELVHSTHEIFVFGGFSQSPNRTLSDFWKFNVKNDRWTLIEVSWRVMEVVVLAALALAVVVLNGFANAVGFDDLQQG
ncbi:hypothetical protein WDU94_008853 [Cyamophila willieti]